ncbi:exonuclease subunit SbcD [Flavobacterium gawalongense]|uniref:Nuclease SbcCD subunit D n=1 Tax=Flavobacterium gawalongense TaxID=2594432 RepID=A0A553BC57_9FLAO|nr:exonuclease subunit SbcD [Flavobacterium gawalongense]TRX05825.1 exonuclease subunit SbcD [Flavobacterium gawalongense]TRX06754.1 exonuclease subunit SbcD [Flavobacterium gawalongense]TRX22489.1 exonuclease subunit SbcD [Flavobacterium gawalongense]
MSLKIVHTADWHLGQTFLQKSRIEEHQYFIDWLLETIQTQDIDAIIIAGDIFDVSNPTIEALNKYHYFLTEAYKKGVQVVIVGGNHDSASRLNSYKDIFKILNVSVVGGEHNNTGTIIPIFKRGEKNPSALVAAVPYLRDGDIRKISTGETIHEAHGLFTAEVKKHYDDLLNQAKTNYPNLPVIGTAHLYINSCVLSEPAEKRMHTLVGTLGQIPSSVFSKGYDYVAMGHIHKPQMISHPEDVVLKYSGSPIPLSFNERNDQKEITILTIADNKIAHESLSIPLQRSVIRFEGKADEIMEKIKLHEPSQVLPTWAEIIITEAVNYIEFNNEVNDLCIDKKIEILNRTTKFSSMNNQSIREEYIAGTDNNPLDDIPKIFTIRCEKKGMNEESIAEIMPLFMQILDEINDTH